MSWQMINHRGPEYKDLLYRTTEGVKQVFETKNDLYILTSSGTGAMEAAIVNTLSPGDKVVNVCVGVFGERFGDIAEVFGAEVISLDFPYGSAADPDKIRETLNENPDAIAAVVKGEFDKLLLVDGISSVCSIPISTDAWGCDVVATASQKGWMLPPGLAFLSFSERAWEAHSEAKMPRYYFDMAMYKRYYEIGQPPYTPAISVMFALDVALKRILDEGMGNIYERHATIAQMTRDGVKKLGLTLFPEESVASDTVTAVNIPQGVDGGKLVGTLRDEHGVILTGGQGSLAGKIFRIGHLGYTTEREIHEVLDAIKVTLN
ncbi:Serine-pyruvate aminotransferase [Geodia barretti]|uniref:Serine-pyruvate aminotransferase n=1 Tax=Geodia barretti TaxID=519541 RepID=A0AA35T113_GEOBA|nr:Serine-pyruvate aminotransferase [Geodia barretti]